VINLTIFDVSGNYISGTDDRLKPYKITSDVFTGAILNPHRTYTSLKAMREAELKEPGSVIGKKFKFISRNQPAAFELSIAGFDTLLPINNVKVVRGFDNRGDSTFVREDDFVQAEEVPDAAMKTVTYFENGVDVSRAREIIPMMRSILLDYNGRGEYVDIVPEKFKITSHFHQGWEVIEGIALEFRKDRITYFWNNHDHLAVLFENRDKILRVLHHIAIEAADKNIKETAGLEEIDLKTGETANFPVGEFKGELVLDIHMAGRQVKLYFWKPSIDPWGRIFYERDGNDWEEHIDAFEARNIGPIQITRGMDGVNIQNFDDDTVKIDIEHHSNAAMAVQVKMRPIKNADIKVKDAEGKEVNIQSKARIKALASLSRIPALFDLLLNGAPLPVEKGFHRDNSFGVSGPFLVVDRMPQSREMVENVLGMVDIFYLNGRRAEKLGEEEIKKAATFKGNGSGYTVNTGIVFNTDGNCDIGRGSVVIDLGKLEKIHLLLFKKWNPAGIDLENGEFSTLEIDKSGKRIQYGKNGNRGVSFAYSPRDGEWTFQEWGKSLKKLGIKRYEQAITIKIKFGAARLFDLVVTEHPDNELTVKIVGGFSSSINFKDAEMTAAVSAHAPEVKGGIDLNTSNGMQWKVSKDGHGVEMNIDPAMIAQIRAHGIDSLSPIIFSITPVTSIWPLVGLKAPATAVT